MLSRIRIRKAVPLIASLGFVSLLLCFPQMAAMGVSEGLSCCCGVLIPSLFPFMVLSSFMMRSGAAELAGGAVSPAVRLLFDLPGVCGAAVLLSFIGGFPVGAKCVRLLYDRRLIDSEQAQRMMCFCVCSGPAFLVTAVGSIMLNDPFSGVILYLSQLFSGLIIGIILGIRSRLLKKSKKSPANNIKPKCKILMGKKFNARQQNLFTVIRAERSERQRAVAKPPNDSPGTGSQKYEPASDSFIAACSDGASSMLDMTALVVIFFMLLKIYSGSSMSEFIKSLLGGSREAACIIPIISEVTSGCRTVLENGMPLWWFSLAAGFGGFCVHFQIFSILGSVPLKKRIYILFRMINALLSALITWVICSFLVRERSVFSISGGYEAAVSSVTIAGSAALIVLSVLFVLTFNKENLIIRQGVKSNTNKA